MSFYRAPNARIIQRGAGGRFRISTLDDIGMACCPTCGRIYAPDYESLGPMPDPRAWNELKNKCPNGCTARPAEKE